MRTTIIHKFQSAFLYVPFCGYGISTFAANCEVQKLKVFRSTIFAGFPILNKRHLNFIKQFLGNHGLVASLMHFIAVTEMSVVKWISEHIGNGRKVGEFAVFANQAKRKHFAL